MRIPLPTLAEQTAIAEVLSDMDAELAALGAAPRQDPRPQAGHDAGIADREDAPGMSTITPHYRSVQQLLQSQSFSIDEYQREYKWEKENIDELLVRFAG